MIVAAGCGYTSAGTWEDDDDNWERAFNQNLPKEIILVHSWYWRSPHFTLEQEFFFELEPNEKIMESFLGKGDLQIIDSNSYHKINHFNEKPKWFTPKNYQSYDIWISNDYDNFFLFKEKESKHIFWSDSQI